MNIRDWLVEKKITQTEFADVLGISRAHLSSIVVGRNKASRKLAKKIAQATNYEIKEEDILTKKATGYMGEKKPARRKTSSKVISFL